MSKPKTTARPPLRLIDFEKQRRKAAQRDTVLVLQALHSKALRGEVSDLLLCYRDGAEDQWVMTGAYEDPKSAINAATRITWRLTARQEDGE